MARNNKKTEEHETEESYATGYTGETAGADQPTDPYAGEPSDDLDPVDGEVPISEDEFRPVLWPQKTDVCVLATRARWFVPKPDSKMAGDPPSLIVEFTASKHQIVDAVEDFAGQNFEVWFRRKKGQNAAFKSLLLATFSGALPASVNPTHFLNRAYILQVRHYSATDKDTNQKVTRMDFHSIRPDPSVGEE